MKLLVIRHAIAADREAWATTGEPDDRRPLTEEGRQKMRRAAAGLEEFMPRLDLLGTSPYRRALETAEIIAARYRKVPLAVVDELIPDRPLNDLANWILRLDDVDHVGVVGHEPHLGEFVSYMMFGEARGCVELKKGGAVLLNLPKDCAPGSAKLIWALAPKQLRELG